MRKGFSLVELVISITLLTTVMMLVFNLFPAASVAVHRSQQDVKANALAQSHLEIARTQPFPSLALGTKDMPDVADGPITYKVRQRIFVVPGEPTEELRGIKVTVSWEYRKRHHELSQESYVVRIPR